MGPEHGGFEFLKGSFSGIEGYAMGRMTKSHRGKIYIDDAGWGPEADSIEYGYRVPFGGIHVFIGKIGGSEPEPDTYIDRIESTRCTQPARIQPGRKHVFVGFTQGMELAEGSESGGETAIYSGDGPQPERRNPSISFRTAGLGATLMATVFWTPMIRLRGLQSSWLALGRLSTRQQRRL